MSDLLQEALRAARWEPSVVVDEPVVETGPVAALQALLDDGLAPVEEGDPLPPLWHWVALSRWTPASLLAEDGHPQKGDFLPPVPYPRRMFAGGEMTVHRPLLVGTTCRREQQVIHVEHKDGRSGELFVVQVATRLYDLGGELAVEERQDLVYRAAPAEPTSRGSEAPTSTLSPAGGKGPLDRTAEWVWSVSTDPVLLMRFSAATANAHRIHYDRSYATEVEGYPALVVHGPLTTLLLAETLRLERPELAARQLSYRNLAPLFCGDLAMISLAELLPADLPGQVSLSLASGGTERTHLTALLEEHANSRPAPSIVRQEGSTHA